MPNESVRQVLNEGRKHPENPVLSPRPGCWDGTRCKVYGTVFYDEDDRLFKMWYSGGEDTPDAIRREYGSYRHIGYAVSQDGVHWERPNLGLIDFRGSKDNNLVVLDAQAPSVFKNPEGLALSEPYVMFTQAGQDTVQTRVLYSSDGIRWRVRTENAIDSGTWGEKSHEPFSILHDPESSDPNSRWKGYSLIHVFRNGYRGRAVGYYFGEDPYCWTECERQPIMDTTFALESEIHIPHVTRFHDDYVMLYDAMEPWHDTQTEIAISRNGVDFERVQNGTPVVRRGGPGEHDAAKVCVSPHSLFVHDGKIWWYYTASTNNYQTCPRGGRGEPWYRYTGLAQWRQDGFAHLQLKRGAELAILTTADIELPSGKDLDIRCNVETPTQLIVEVIDQSEQVLASGLIPAGDHLSGSVVWRKPMPAVTSEMVVRLRVYLSTPDARLYSLSIAGAKRAGEVEEKSAHRPAKKAYSRWTFEAGDKITAQPLVQGDRVYVGSWDASMYAIDLQTGEELWKFGTNNAIVAGAAVTGNRLIFGSRDGNVYAVDSETGEETWRRQMGSMEDVLLTPNGPWVECPPAIGQYKPGKEATTLLGAIGPYKLGFGDRVFVGSHHRRLAAINPETGALCWEFPTFNWILGRPLVADYRVYFGSVDGYLYAVDAMCGALEWRYRTGDSLEYAPGVIPGSVSTKAVTATPILHGHAVYFGGHDGFMHAVHRATGERLWTRQIGRTLPSRAAICGPLVVVVSNDGLVTAMDALSGKVVWRRDLAVTVHADIVSHDSSSFWVTKADGELLRLDVDGKIVQRIETGGTIRATPSLTLEGDLLVGTCQGEIICIPVECERSAV